MLPLLLSQSFKNKNEAEKSNQRFWRGVNYYFEGN